MFVNYWLGMIGTIILWIALIVLSFWFFRNRFNRLPAKFKLLLCLVVASLPMVPLLEIVLFPVIVIGNDGSCHKTILFGSTECDLGNGEKTKISFDYPNTIIVNRSNEDYVLETVVYTTSASDNTDAAGVMRIPAHTAKSKKTQIDFYPDETPPDEVSLGSHELRQKGWLRKATPEDF